MASFDIVNKIDIQTLDNAINAAKREISTRYDFRGSNTTLELDKKTNMLHIVTEDEMKMDAIESVIISRLIKGKIDPKSLDLGEEKYAAGKQIKKDILVKSGIDKESARKIIKAIKELKLKVQPQLMDEQIRVNGKKLDELQKVISLCRSEDFGTPLQFINMK